MSTGKDQALRAAFRRAGIGSGESGRRRGGIANDVRLLDQSARALRRVAEWLRDCDEYGVEGTTLDDLGSLIGAVDEALAEAEALRDVAKGDR